MSRRSIGGGRGGSFGSRSSSTSAGRGAFVRRTSLVQRPPSQQSRNFNRSLTTGTTRRQSLQRPASFQRTGTAPPVKRMNRRPSYGGGTWKGNRFYRDRNYGWFGKMNADFFHRRPWFLQWYNSRYYFPLVFLRSLVTFPILAIDTYNQYELENYIVSIEERERAAGRAPPPPSYLVPNFSVQPPVLVWASPVTGETL